MDTFLSQVADVLIDRGIDFEEYTFVFPQKRAVEVFRGVLRNKLGDTDGMKIDMMTVTRLFNAYSGLRAADTTDMIFRVYAAYLKVCKDRKAETPMTLDEFLPWGEMMLGDFDDVDKALADAHSVFRELNNLRDIEDINFADKESLENLKRYFSTFAQALDPGMRQKYHNMWNFLSDIYDELNASTDKKTYEGAIYRKGLEKLKNKSDGRKFVFIGFNVLTGAESELMDYLKRESRAGFFWDYTPGFTTEKNEAVSEIKKNYDRYGGWIPSTISEQNKPAFIVDSSTQSGEAAYVSAWLGDVKPKKGDFTAIIPLDESAVSVLRHFLPHKRYDIHINYPVGITAAYAKVKRACDEYVAKNVDDKDYSAEGLINDLRDKVESLNPSADDGEWEKQAQKFAGEALDVCENIIKSNAGLKVSPRVMAYIYLSQFASANLEAAADNADNDDDRLRIDVVSLADTRTIDFDNILLLDCNEGKLPSTSRKPSMLPNAVRKAYGIPLLGGGSGVQAYNFFRLLKRTPKITIVYSSAISSIGSNEVSRYILQMYAGEIKRQYKVKALRSKSKYVEDHPLLEVEKTKEMLERIKTLEPTPMNAYLECGMKFYYSKVARVRVPLPEPDKMPVNLFGTIFHGAMQKYYETKNNRIEKSTIAQDLKDKTSKNIIECIDNAFKESEVPVNAIVKDIVLRYMRKVLEYDEKKAPFDIQPEYIEKFIYTPITSKSGYTARVGGRFDRVHTKDGKYVVVDYKTGRYDEKKVKSNDVKSIFSKSEKERVADYMLQLLVYSMALKDNLISDNKYFEGLVIEPELYYTAEVARKGEEYSPNVKIGKDEVYDFGVYEDDVRAGVQEVVDEIFDINSPFKQTDVEKVCQRCDFRELCGR